MEKYISYYKLMEELAEEEGKKHKGKHGMDDEAFKSYRNSKKRHFENILKQTGLYEKYYCQEKGGVSYTNRRKRSNKASAVARNQAVVKKS